MEKWRNEFGNENWSVLRNWFAPAKMPCKISQCENGLFYEIGLGCKICMGCEIGLGCEILQGLPNFAGVAKFPKDCQISQGLQNSAILAKMICFLKNFPLHHLASVIEQFLQNKHNSIK